MFELLKLFPRRPLAVSVAAWVFFFVAQIVLLTVVASRRYVSTPDSPPSDSLWFVYTELPKVLPMAAVYAVCAVFVAQVIGRFVSGSNPDNPTFGELYGLLKRNPVRAITWMALRVIFLLALVALFIDPALPPSLLWVKTLSALLVGLLAMLIIFNPWISWLVEGVTSRDDSDARRESIIGDPNDRQRPRKRQRSRYRRSAPTSVQGADSAAKLAEQDIIPPD